MHGRTKIHSLGTTISAWTYETLKIQALLAFPRRKDHADRLLCIEEMVSEIIVTGSGKDTIKGMTAGYLSSMSSETFIAFRKRLVRDVERELGLKR
jgi:hypothetical protein